jgi:predicted nucleic acid-binding protein
MPAIVDTGPLVAFFDRAERHHAWAVEHIERLEPPLLLCEPVLTEAMYLLSRFAGAPDALLELVGNGALTIAFHVEDHADVLRTLLRKYRDVPMSLAAACLVRMAEIYDGRDVVTLDSDFSIYRRHGRVPLSLIRPDGV